MREDQAGEGHVRRQIDRDQLVVIVSGAVMLGIDGYDVISVSVALPGIAAEWGLDGAQLGWILAVEVLGAALGAALLGTLADALGRRRIILACLGLMASGMALTAIADNPVTLGIIRFLTGIGLGGLNPAVTAMVSEAVSEHRRDQSVAMLGLGYALGAIVGGASAAWLLSFETWRAVFATGSGLTVAILLLSARFIPETLQLTSIARSPRALDAGQTERRFFRRGRDRTARREKSKPRLGMLAVLSPPHLRNAWILTLASIAQLSTFYFCMKWLPKLAVDAGMSVSAAASIMTLFNVGGLIGMLAMGPLARQMGLKAFTMAALFSSGVAIYVLALCLGDYATVLVAAAVAGILANAAFGGLYASIARAYPAALRSSGIGLTLGLGRAVSSAAPIITGTMFSLGATVPAVALGMALSACAAALLIAYATIDY